MNKFVHQVDGEPTEFVSLASALTDEIEAILASHDIDGAAYVMELFDIAENCDDPDNPIDKATYQRLFIDLELILPTYIQLLDESLCQYGREMYARDLKGIPRLLLDNGQKQFSLLQQAAMHHGVNDEHVKYMYLMLGMVIGNIFREGETATKH